jgi:hypothetical protein
VIRPSFWTGTTGRALRRKPPTVRVVALYLMTAPGANMIGLYYLPLTTLAHDTGMEPAEVQGALQELAALGFAHHDAEQELIWVPEMAAHQVGPTMKPRDNRQRGVLRELEQHEGSRFADAFRARYGQAYSLPPGHKPLPSPSQGGQEGVTDSPYSRDYVHAPALVHAPKGLDQGTEAGYECPSGGPLTDGESTTRARTLPKSSVSEHYIYPAPQALAVLLAAAGAHFQGEGEPGRVRLGKRQATATGLSAPQERAWLTAWGESGGPYGEAGARRLGEALAAKVAYKTRPLGVGELIAKLPDLLAEAQAWDGSAPATGEPPVRTNDWHIPAAPRPPGQYGKKAAP